MSVASGKAKWEAKMQNADAKYQARKGEMATNYQRGLSDAGVQVGPNTLQAYQSGIQRATLANVAGKSDKWERNYRAGMAR